MPSHQIHADLDGGYYTQGQDLTAEQKQEAAEYAAQKFQEKLAEFGATFPNGDIQGVIQSGIQNG